MRTCLNNGKHEAGFTLAELLTIVAIIAILASIAIPTFSVWLPNFRLKGAARDLYSSLQMAKLGAVKHNKQWAVVFDQTNNRYYVCSDDGGLGWNNCPNDSKEKTVNFSDYKEDTNFGFGHGSLLTRVDGENFLNNEDIYYTTNDFVVFNPRGTSEKGYVYLQNKKNTVYGVGTRPSGVIYIKKWTGSDWN